MLPWLVIMYWPGAISLTPVKVHPVKTRAMHAVNSAAFKGSNSCKDLAIAQAPCIVEQSAAPDHK